MSIAENLAQPSLVLDRLLPLCAEAEATAESFDIAAKNAVRKLIAPSAASMPGCWNASSSPRTAMPGSPPTSPACARCGAGARR